MQNKQPLVSIITPTYNHEHYIEKCIQSVLSQTYEHWQLVVVNDGSTDSTLARCQDMARQDKRITVVDQENHGLFRLHETYNKALALSTGEYVAILEGDDWWPADKLEIQVNYHLNDPGLLISHGKVIQSDGLMDKSEYPRPPIEGTASSEQYLRLMMLKESCFMPVSVMTQKRALESIGGFKSYAGFPAVDLPTFRDILLMGGNVAWIDSVLGYWRHSPNQATSTTFTPGVDRVTQNILLGIHDNLNDGQRAKIQLSRAEVVESTTKKIIVPGLIAALRKSLREKDRTNSAKFIWQIMRIGNARNRGLAALGLLAAVFRFDIEALYRKQ